MPDSSRLAGAICLLALAGCAASERLPGGPRQAAPDEARQYAWALALLTELKYDQAAESLARLVPRFRSGTDQRRAAEAMFWLAFCREKLGQRGEGIRAYEELIAAYPASAPAAQARQRLDRLARPAASAPAQ